MAREIWRLLEAGETILTGDQYFSSSAAEWFDTYENEATLGGRGYQHRRRETIKDEPKWEKFSDHQRSATVVKFDNGVVAMEGGTFRFVLGNDIIPHRTTHWLKLPELPKEPDPFETFWQTHKHKLLDSNKESIRLIYEEARKL